MLVNETPFKGHERTDSAWELGSFMQGKLRFYQADGWAERSVRSRDFIRRLMCKSQDRLTAAQALLHPWLQSFAPLGTPRWSALPPPPGKEADSSSEDDAQ